MLPEHENSVVPLQNPSEGAPDSIVITTVARVLIPFIQIYALYVVMHGHSSPGGGFQGGVILGASLILLAVSHNVDHMARRLSLKKLTIVTSLGVFLYGFIGLLCIFLGGNFLDYSVLLPEAWAPRSMGMLGIEIGVGLTVAAVMISIFRDLIYFREDR